MARYRRSLTLAFLSFIKPVQVRLVKTPAGKSKGFAFVEFSQRQSALEAIAR